MPRPTSPLRALLSAGLLLAAATGARAQVPVEDEASYSSVIVDLHPEIAWGDVDGDGDLDLAVAGAPLRVYTNDRGRLEPIPSFTAAYGGRAQAVAWGDVDGDGDLDLAVGLGYRIDGGRPNRLYLNEGGVLERESSWISIDSDETSTLAFGDVDGDGDLDLAVGNRNQPNKLYRNIGGTLEREASWQTTASAHTKSLAWGDVDRDGDLDLAVGNRKLVNRIYFNEGGELATEAGWVSLTFRDTEQVAWGDLNGDGWLDLATANIDNTFPVTGRNEVFLNVGGTLELAPSWVSSERDESWSVAWGDMDGDGDLDLVVGNGVGEVAGEEDGEPIAIYLNRDGSLPDRPDWKSTDADQSRSVALGDVDGDGDLDIAVANGERQLQPVRVYRNLLEPLEATASVTFLENDFTTSLAFADVDGDGDLDLAVGNGGDDIGGVEQCNRLYLNDGTGIVPTAPCFTDVLDDTWAIAWGDVDGDGDPDLAVGNYGHPDYEPDRVYRNDGGVLDPQPMWTSDATVGTTAVAWADIDGDGDLDLGLGAMRRFLHLHENRDGELATDDSSASLEAINVRALAWADADLDGDPDLAVGGDLDGNSALLHFYRNPGGFPARFGAELTSVERDETTSVAWGDVDGDGDPDLAVGNAYGGVGFEPNRVYENRAGTPESTATYVTVDRDPTLSIAWGDVDGDGDLDLAVGNAGTGSVEVPFGWTNAVYRNTGRGLEPTASFRTTEADATRAVAWGDVDGDGDLDLASGNFFEPVRIHLNRRERALAATAGLPDAPPTVRIEQPLGEQGGVVEIAFTLTDPEGDLANVVPRFGFETSEWLPATPAADSPPTRGLGTSPEGTAHTFLWDAEADRDRLGGDRAQVRFGLIAIPASQRLPAFTLLPRTETRPFRVDVAPSLVRLAIDGGAEYTVSRSVTLDLGAAGARQMKLSNEGFGGGSWEDFAPRVEWQLPAGEGFRTVFASFRDFVGERSPEISRVSDSIILDGTPPVISALAVTERTADRLSAEWSAADPGSLIQRFEYAIGTAPYPDAGFDDVTGGFDDAFTNGSVSVPGSFDPGTLYHFTLRATNFAGLSRTETVAADLDRPFLADRTLVDGDVLGPVFDASFTLSDGSAGSGVDDASVVVRLDGQRLSFDYDPDTDRISFSVNGLDLGSHVLEIVARDAAGNLLDDSIRFLVSDPSILVVDPAFTVLRPAETRRFRGIGGEPGALSWTLDCVGDAAGCGTLEPDPDGRGALLTAGAEPGAYTLRARDARGRADTAGFEVDGSVRVSPSTLSLPLGAETSFVARGGTAPYTWQLSGGVGVPGGDDGERLAFTAGDVPGIYSVRATDATGRRFTATIVLIEDQGRAIIVGGGGSVSTNPILAETSFLTRFAYQALQAKGFDRADIRYLAAFDPQDPDPCPDGGPRYDGDGDGDPCNDVDGEATQPNLDDAITRWAIEEAGVGPNVPLWIYLMDHGLPDEFLVNQTCLTPGCNTPEAVISSAELAGWLDALPAGTPVVLIYDACYAGSFVDEVAATGRVTAVSSRADELSFFSSNGAASFSGFLFTNLVSGLSLLDAFNASTLALPTAWSRQQRPGLDDNGNGELNDPDEGDRARDIFLGARSGGTRFPLVLRATPRATIGLGEPLVLDAAVSSDGAPDRVWASIADPEDPLDVELLELARTDDPGTPESEWSRTFDGFVHEGVWTIAFQAQVGALASLPRVVEITVGDPPEPLFADDFESGDLIRWSQQIPRR